MKLIKTSIPDIILIKPKVHTDQRGYFVETFRQKELDETIKRVEREKKKAQKKEKLKDAKQDIRKKMSVIAASSLNNDEDLILD